MPQKRVDRFFPAESFIHKKNALSTVYCMEFAEGTGTMTSWKVMPGITLIFNDFHTPCGFPEEARCPACGRPTGEWGEGGGNASFDPERYERMKRGEPG